MTHPNGLFPALGYAALLLLASVMAAVTAACLDRPAIEVCGDVACPAGWRCGATGVDCEPRICGDSIEDPGEVCDDGNNTDGDGCSADCSSSCGNGYRDLAHGETCDDGNIISGDGCDENCLLEDCGDGVVDDYEACDDGNNIDGDGCSANCLSDETCGNGYIDRTQGETCDDGDIISGDGCSETCVFEDRDDDV